MDEATEQIPRGIFSLPNEILLRIIDIFDTKSVAALTTLSRHFHCLALRVIHNRLQIASGLNGHEFYLECHPPATRLTASRMFCRKLGTEGLEELRQCIERGEQCSGQLKQAFALYSRFRPQHHEPEAGRITWSVPGDIPGSRTHPSTNPEQRVPGPEEAVSQTVSIDAGDLFSQLQTLAFLGKRHYGFLTSFQEVSQSYIRVWRDWLAKACETKLWSDGEPIVVHHEPATAGGGLKNGCDDSAERLDPRNDPKVLWLSTRDQNVGIKFRVKERKYRRAAQAPILYASENELPVSYHVEFEEVIVRTTHLILVMEEAEKQLLNDTGRSVIFASIRGP
ncbi:uncharacterized protein LTR77_010851 [Saxophila tyrrhenica]|uniref:F-box domain-containing protein n=1 Tax=Saxophila tyrrhenica TaxID=1690608 RepID=A0AAV9NUJ9_9PEZI|nr:hypothetical protein LTR77_010851 [Saxophila tyrrhenica]